MKQLSYNLLQKGTHGADINKYFDYGIMSLIFINIGALILESIPEFQQQYSLLFQAIEYFSIIIFTLEYVMRIYIADMTHPASNNWKSAFLFIFSFYGMVDLLSILPFYLPLIIPIDLRFLRILRLFRFLRVLKLNRYTHSVDLIFQVISEKKNELYMTCFLTIMILVIASFLMFYAEGHHQPEAFPNILAAFWWAVATLTTVGYGDVYPITGLGKFISGMIAIIGIGLVALPTGLISAGFMEKIHKEKKQNKTGSKHTCPHCGKDFHEHS
ncbi:ion transporter [Persicobacter diffluens]